jgi:hypothetical protein
LQSAEIMADLDLESYGERFADVLRNATTIAEMRRQRIGRELGGRCPGELCRAQGRGLKTD